MHGSAFEHPPEVDEFEAVGLKKAPSVIVRPPRVALAPVAMECKLEREFTVGEFEDHSFGGVSFGFISETMSMTLRGATSTQQLSCQ
jgi:flavin reductase (DIM6/NTAB) family NADH-FMN oxidoreductase RutF